MAKAEVVQQSRRRQNRFLVVLLVGATLVSAAKDLGRLHDWTSNVVGFAATVQQRVNAVSKSPAEPSCPQILTENDRSGQPFNWNGRVAPDQSSQMSDSKGGIDAVAVVGADLDPAAIKIAGRCDSPSVPVQIVVHATRVARRTPPAKEFSRRRDGVEFGWTRSANQSATIRLLNNIVQRNFNVRLPAGIGFTSRMINQEIKTTSFDTRQRVVICPLGIACADARFMNRVVSIPDGAQQAEVQINILDKEINARLAESNRTDATAPKAARRIVYLDLLQIMGANIEAEALDEDTVSESERPHKGMIQRARSAAPALADDAH